MAVAARREHENWDREEDRTCTHHGCGEFGTHRVITHVHGEKSTPIVEWMCREHSLGYVMVLRLSCSDEAEASRVEVAR